MIPCRGDHGTTRGESVEQDGSERGKRKHVQMRSRDSAAESPKEADRARAPGLAEEVEEEAEDDRPRWKDRFA